MIIPVGQVIELANKKGYLVIGGKKIDKKGDLAIVATVEAPVKLGIMEMRTDSDGALRVHLCDEEDMDELLVELLKDWTLPDFSKPNGEPV